MTNNTRTGSFWTTLPGILTGIGAVLAGILAIIEVFQPGGDSSPSTNSSPVPNQASPIATPAPNQASPIARFFVEANDEFSKSYTNRENEPIVITYEAKKNDSWVAIPSEGDLSLYGIRNFPANTSAMLCPEESIGALVVIIYHVRNRYYCAHSGPKGTFSLNPSQTAYFLMNDVRDFYYDNKGSATVELYKDK